jgi:hypothetical protein
VENLLECPVVSLRELLLLYLPLYQLQDRRQCLLLVQVLCRLPCLRECPVVSLLVLLLVCLPLCPLASLRRCLHRVYQLLFLRVRPRLFLQASRLASPLWLL